MTRRRLPDDALEHIVRCAAAGCAHPALEICHATGHVCLRWCPECAAERQIDALAEGIDVPDHIEDATGEPVTDSAALSRAAKDTTEGNPA